MTSITVDAGSEGVKWSLYGKDEGKKWKASIGMFKSFFLGTLIRFTECLMKRVCRASVKISQVCRTSAQPSLCIPAQSSQFQSEIPDSTSRFCTMHDIWDLLYSFCTARLGGLITHRHERRCKNTEDAFRVTYKPTQIHIQRRFGEGSASYRTRLQESSRFFTRMFFFGFLIIQKKMHLL